MRKKLLIIPMLAFAFFTFQAPSAFACGGLISPDGDIRLERASTLIAWHNGVEHYLTTFAYQENNSVANVGWIVPLPAVPETIQDGGAWTLQRLNIESHPIQRSLFAPQVNTAASSAQVLQQVQIEALNVTVIKGSGQEILNWAGQNGFTVGGDTRAHLLKYAQGSPIFMAAKYDTHLAQTRHQLQGDGVPLLITMKIPHPWVPLEVLALDGQQVQADLYFLTDMPLNVSDLSARVGQSAVGSDIPGATGFKVAFQEKMPAQLYQDLSSDRNMGWVWPDSWFTSLSLDAPSEQVSYDLGVSTTGVIRLAPFGTAPMAVVDGTKTLPSWIPTLPMSTPQWVEGFLGIGLATLLVFFLVRRRSRAKLLSTAAS
ncbi:MAG TPA: DUF2330 domain-containing protein [Ktedonobacteraceae bacterium]|nr:DUF2330 domain-containing protein [Ktedonobacteraceae bacterium]